MRRWRSKTLWNSPGVWRDCSDPRAAFSAYQQLHHERVEKGARMGGRINQDKAAGPVARIFRDAMMPFFLKRFAKPETNAWMYGHHIAFDEPIETEPAPA